MKTKIFKQLSLSILSVLVVSGVVYASTTTPVTNLTFTDIGAGSTITETWYSLVNGALSKIFNDNLTFKNGSIPSSALTGTISASQITGLSTSSIPATGITNWNDLPINSIPASKMNYSTPASFVVWCSQFLSNCSLTEKSGYYAVTITAQPSLIVYNNRPAVIFGFYSGASGNNCYGSAHVTYYYFLDTNSLIFISGGDDITCNA